MKYLKGRKRSEKHMKNVDNINVMWTPVCPGPEAGAADSGCPPARTKHSATLLGGRIYLLGGRNGNIPLKDLWSYTLSEGKWEQLKPSGDCPPSLQEHSAVTYQGSIYVFGGEVGFSSTETPLWIYDVKNNRWRKVSSRKGAAVPHGRRGHSALVHRGAMLIYGGYQDLKGSLNDLWAYYFESKSWHLLSSNSRGGSIPPGRHKHSAVLHDDAMWIYGGMQDLNEKSDCWKWDTVSGQWYQMRCKFSPGPLHSHAACRLPGYMLIFGGESNGQPTNELWRFHFTTEMWEKLHVSGKKPQPRSESIAIAVSELHLQGDPCTTPLGGPKMRSRSRCATTDRTARHSSYLPNNKVTPCEKTYVFKASNKNYTDGSSSQGNENTKLLNTPPNSSGGILKEITKLSQINISRLGHNKCSYTVLTSNNDSTESLVHQNPIKQSDFDWSSESQVVKNSMVKSQSAHVINKRKVAISGLISPVIPEVGNFVQPKAYISRQQASINEWKRKEMTREPISVPNFSDLTLPTPVLTPVEAARLVFLDSEEEEGYNNDVFDPPADDHDIVQVLPAPTPCDFAIIHNDFQTNVRDESYSSHLASYATENHTYENIPKIPKSTSVRFQNYPDLEEASDENISTSDYASIEAVNKISSYSTNNISGRLSYTPQEEIELNGFSQIKSNMKHSDTAFGFCNPNYMGPDIQTILTNNRKQSLYQDPSMVSTNTNIAKMLNTPDSGITDSRSDSRQLFSLDDMVEMQEFSSSTNNSKIECLKNPSFHERGLPPRSLTIESPYSPYQNKEVVVKPRAKSSSRAERQRTKEVSIEEEAHDTSCFTSDIVIPLYVYVLGGKEQGQVAVFKRPLSMWKYQLF